jgi:hypothetical protein
MGQNGARTLRDGEPSERIAGIPTAGVPGRHFPGQHVRGLCTRHLPAFGAFRLLLARMGSARYPARRRKRFPAWRLGADRSGGALRRQRDCVNTLTFRLDEPPSLNEMIRLAKMRVRVGRDLKPLVYDSRKRAYETKALADLRLQGLFPPREPWSRWRIEHAEIRRHNLLDLLEMMACAKWCVDALVKGRYVAGDGPYQLLSLGTVEQKIDRANRGITLTISRVET